ncbi:unnamed protein product [Sphacelaria rigidula]
MTQIQRDNQRVMRRLELNEKAGTLTWPITRVMGIFGNPFERVRLKKARIICTDKLVKIGPKGRRDFFIFEACDENEATAVCDCLVAVVRNLSQEDAV